MILINYLYILKIGKFGWSTQNDDNKKVILKFMKWFYQSTIRTELSTHSIIGSNQVKLPLITLKY